MVINPGSNDLPIGDRSDGESLRSFVNGKTWLNGDQLGMKISKKHIVRWEGEVGSYDSMVYGRRNKNLQIQKLASHFD